MTAFEWLGHALLWGVAVSVFLVAASVAVIAGMWLVTALCGLAARRR